MSVVDEKEMRQRDARKQEKMRSVPTNLHVRFPCVVPFQVYEDLSKEFRLQYLSKEKKFTLIERVLITKMLLIKNVLLTSMLVK
ncbi:hypothetical protein PVK06_043564 [Gossypium arboreum]|uniref:Uncharacterized protein n=1 Tax=Gossypium arboreum TaxID=29729 RepID=A0ABR0MP50_GOSAR|nr:hypothetical protein PVK06_043564 [Gossypium arboreum]